MVARRHDTIRFRGYSARGAGPVRQHLRRRHPGADRGPGLDAVHAEALAGRAAHLLERYGKAIYREYGFVDAFNPTFGAARTPTPRIGNVIPGAGWVDDGYLGIDQGPILLMIENYRSGLVWRVMRRNPYIRRGLERAGFRGGWLDKPAPGGARVNIGARARDGAHGAAGRAAAGRVPRHAGQRPALPR